VQPRKKDLTFLAFALIMAQSKRIFASLLYYWRARADRTLSSAVGRVGGDGCFT